MPTEDEELEKNSTGTLSIPPSIPLWQGVAWGLLSAIGYTVANVFLKMSERDGLNPVWVSFVKAIPTVAIYGPFVIWQLRAGKITYPTRKAFLLLLVASIAGHYCGNLAFQWSLGVVGVAMSVPLCLGTLILGGAILGRIFLQERISIQSAVSIFILIIAILVLCLGANEASLAVQISAVEVPWWIVLLGVLCACLAGLSYAALGAAIRYGVTGTTSVTTTLVIVCGTGMLSLAPLCLYSPGLKEVLSTSYNQWSMMLLAGLFNAIAFFALTKALKITNVTFVNSLNASQTAMAAVAGVMLFNEKMSWALILGVLLTVVGLLLMRREHVEEHELEEHIGETG